ncbi:MAG: hypothetical protein U0T83_01140 [Bacteriovoracaceae bacterium]
MFLQKLQKVMLGLSLSLAISVHAAEIGGYEDQIKNLSSDEKSQLEAGQVLAFIGEKVKGYSWKPNIFYVVIPTSIERVVAAYWDVTDIKRYNSKINWVKIVSRSGNRTEADYEISAPLVGSTTYTITTNMNHDNNFNSYKFNYAVSKSSFMKKTDGTTVFAPIDGGRTLMKTTQIADPAWALTIIPGSQSRARKEAGVALNAFVKNGPFGPNYKNQIMEFNKSTK